MERIGRGGDDSMFKTAAIPGRENYTSNPLKGSPDLTEVAFRIEHSSPGSGLENLKQYASTLKAIDALVKQGSFVPWILLAQLGDHALRGRVVAEFLTPSFIKGESLDTILQKLETASHQNKILDDNQSRFRVMLDNEHSTSVDVLVKNTRYIRNFCASRFEKDVAERYINSLPRDRGLQDAVRHAVGL